MWSPCQLNIYHVSPMVCAESACQLTLVNGECSTFHICGVRPICLDQVVTKFAESCSYLCCVGRGRHGQWPFAASALQTLEARHIASKRTADRHCSICAAGSRDTTVIVIPRQPHELSWQLVAHTAGALALPQVFCKAPDTVLSYVFR